MGHGYLNVEPHWPPLSRHPRFCRPRHSARRLPALPFSQLYRPGICLSESLTVAYEYGMYETAGCVLEAWLLPSARWTDGFDGKTDCRDARDDFFVRSGMDAVRGFGGNVWVLWTPSVLVSVRRLGHREAVRRLCAEFDEGGPACAYNVVVSDYASIWWKQDASDPNLTRFPDHRRQLVERLNRCVGRPNSLKA